MSNDVFSLGATGATSPDFLKCGEELNGSSGKECMVSGYLTVEGSEDVKPCIVEATDQLLLSIEPVDVKISSPLTATMREGSSITLKFEKALTSDCSWWEAPRNPDAPSCFLDSTTMVNIAESDPIMSASKGATSVILPLKNYDGIALALKDKTSEECTKIAALEYTNLIFDVFGMRGPNGVPNGVSPTLTSCLSYSLFGSLIALSGVSSFF